ncbi:polyketide cyclase / dehydrase and lipid transport [Skermania piniformis]|uniref:Polyketide cyclase / dehydrase and lipid transport n=1 Tax=Skermania pinensis TaxID=39122 RepID=A0ABX8SB25_9ACTN|nr:polyketide cyclase / dehydrase and lipid transport [Skermania piniformis]QXQ15059.1 polyketide cyclase / dehydrase and lipid transport [Skermania piniformis]
MSTIQIADQTFVAAPAARVAAALADRRRWRQWWPDLVLELRADRAEQGLRWGVSGPVAGTMEVWLEPVLDGVVVHYFLHAEPVAGQSDSARTEHDRRVAGKRMAFGLKTELEAGRPAGVAPAG